MYSNPFKETITVEVNGQIEMRRLGKVPCEGCGIVHTGRCIEDVVDLKGG